MLTCAICKQSCTDGMCCGACLQTSLTSLDPGRRTYLASLTITEDFNQERKMLKERIDLLRENVELRVKYLRDCKTMMEKEHKTLKSVVVPTLEALTKVGDELEDVLCEERKRRIAQLVAFFPVDQVDGTVAGVRLYTAPSSHHYRHVATIGNDEAIFGLALVARLVLIVSHYLHVPLPYAVSFKLAVAHISSPPTLGVVIGASSPYPLDPDRAEFPEAIRMLDFDVKVLCRSQGIPQSALQDSLVDNLWQLLSSPSLGKSVKRSLLDARAREGSRRPQSNAVSHTQFGGGAGELSIRDGGLDDTYDFVLLRMGRTLLGGAGLTF